LSVPARAEALGVDGRAFAGAPSARSEPQGRGRPPPTPGSLSRCRSAPEAGRGRAADGLLWGWATRGMGYSGAPRRLAHVAAPAGSRAFQTASKALPTGRRRHAPILSAVPFLSGRYGHGTGRAT